MIDLRLVIIQLTTRTSSPERKRNELESFKPSTIHQHCPVGRSRLVPRVSRKRFKDSVTRECTLRAFPMLSAPEALRMIAEILTDISPLTAAKLISRTNACHQSWSMPATMHQPVLFKAIHLLPAKALRLSLPAVRPTAQHSDEVMAVALAVVALAALEVWTAFSLQAHRARQEKAFLGNQDMVVVSPSVLQKVRQATGDGLSIRPWLSSSKSWIVRLKIKQEKDWRGSPMKSRLLTAARLERIRLMAWLETHCVSTGTCLLLTKALDAAITFIFYYVFYKTSMYHYVQDEMSLFDADLCRACVIYLRIPKHRESYFFAAGFLAVQTTSNTSSSDNETRLEVNFDCWVSPVMSTELDPAECRSSSRRIFDPRDDKPIFFGASAIPFPLPCFPLPTALSTHAPMALART